MYDYIIVGGGISGLFCLQELYKKKKHCTILIIDDRSYWGGRLQTHKRPHYEIGGARFNDNHKLLLSLLKQYKCHKVKLPSNTLFLHKTKDNMILPLHNVNETLGNIMTNIVKKSKSYSKNTIQQYTLAQWIDYLSKEQLLSKKIKDIFGYDSEINEMNAYDALQSFQQDFISNRFYVVKEGFSELCNKIYLKHKDNQNLSFLHKTLVTNVEKDTEHYKIITNTSKTFCSKNVIFALKASQLKSFSILKPIHPKLKFIYSAPLLRIYAKYPKSSNNKVWFHDLPKIITNSFIRQIIPIDPNSGLIMISYTDNNDINPYWKDKKKQLLKSDPIIMNMIQKELSILFPQASIPKPSYFKTHLWNIGCHHWKPGCDSKSIYNKIKNPLPNIYIIGEAFSQKQAWVEGALETTKQCIELC